VIAFHAADQTSVAAILAEGLRGADFVESGTAINPPGNYLFADEASAELYAERQAMSWGGQWTVLQVDCTGIALTPDTVWAREDKDGAYGQALYTAERIAPMRISLA
jgi:hypothetical protein